MSDDKKSNFPKAWHDLQRQMTLYKGALAPEPGVIKVTTEDGEIVSTEVSATALAAIAVAPDYAEALTDLNAEVKGLSTAVLQTLIDGSLSWGKSGITIVETIAQLKDAGGDEIDIQSLVRSFAVAEKERRNSRRTLVLSIIGSGAVAALVAWQLS